MNYGYIKNKYDSKLLLTETDSLMSEFKAEDVHEDFSSNKETFDFSICSTKSKYCHDLNKFVIEKINDETAGGAIKGCARLKPNMYSFLVDNNSEHKKAKRVMIMLL